MTIDNKTRSAVWAEQESAKEMQGFYKTLADVQPGGRVRLGEQDAQTIEKLRAMMDHSFGGPGFVVYGTAQSIAEVERRLAPSLSAQPSPGGQDALELLARFLHDLLALIDGKAVQ